MLTETYLLSRALQDAAMVIEAQHPAIKVPGASTGPVLRVCLSAAGGIVCCQRVPEDNLPGLWAHFDGNHNSFPVIRLTEPLLVLPDDIALMSNEAPVKGKKSSAAERRGLLLDQLSRARPSDLSKKTLDLLIRLRDKADLLARTLEGQHEGIARVCRAYKFLVPLSGNAPVELITQLRQKAMAYIAVCDDSELDALEVLLFTASSEAGGKRAQIALDDDPSYRSIHSNEVRKTVTGAFLDKEASRTPPTKATGGTPSGPVCAYTGNSDLWAGPFPKVKLRVLGKEFYIFSMNSDAECNVRYHRLTDSQAAPIGRQVVLDIQDALNFVVSEDRKGKTWRSIAGEKPGTVDQLIAYVDGQPNIPDRIADFFGRNEDTQQQQFEVDASAICRALDGISRERPGSRLNLFILRKASEGQAFVVLADAPRVEEVLEGADWWQSAARNVPLGAPSDDYVITLPVLNEEKKSERRKPSVPFPGQVAALLSQAWPNKRGSSDQAKTRANKLRGTAFSEVLDVMLRRRRKAETAARHILSLCINHSGPLVYGLGACRLRQNKESWQAFGDRERLIALTAVSTIGLALFALGSKKEDYMYESAFQLGQLLALADRLHRCYCSVVRDGAMPPTLIGNAVFDAALDSPQKALALLAERIRVYQAWALTAQTERDGQKIIPALEAKKVLRLFQPVAARLHEQGLPDCCDDIDKAHLLLGYLAGQENETRTEGADK